MKSKREEKEKDEINSWVTEKKVHFAYTLGLQIQTYPRQADGVALGTAQGRLE